MDISGVKAGTSEVRITHPGNGAYIGLTIELKSTDTPEFKSFSKKVINQRQKLVARGKNFTADDIEENNDAMLALCVIGWRWELDDDGLLGNYSGEQLEFNRTNTMKLLGVSFIRSQIDDALGDEARFFRD